MGAVSCFYLSSVGCHLFRSLGVLSAIWWGDGGTLGNVVIRPKRRVDRSVELSARDPGGASADVIPLLRPPSGCFEWPSVQATNEGELMNSFWALSLHTLREPEREGSSSSLKSAAGMRSGFSSAGIGRLRDLPLAPLVVSCRAPLLLFYFHICIRHRLIPSCHS